jgi:putative oxidoreductase
MKSGNLLIRIGIGLIFIWGGLEKFIPGFLGGPGLEGATGFIGGVFGVSGVIATIITVGLALTELAAGVLLIAGKKLFETYAVLTLILLVATIMVWIPAGFADMSGANNVTWILVIMHIGLLLTVAGLALEERQKKIS